MGVNLERAERDGWKAAEITKAPAQGTDAFISGCYKSMIAKGQSGCRAAAAGGFSTRVKLAHFAPIRGADKVSLTRRAARKLGKTAESAVRKVAEDSPRIVVKFN